MGGVKTLSVARLSPLFCVFSQKHSAGEEEEGGGGWGGGWGGLGEGVMDSGNFHSSSGVGQEKRKRLKEAEHKWCCLLVLNEVLNSSAFVSGSGNVGRGMFFAKRETTSAARIFKARQGPDSRS